jgi:ribonuclease HI
MSNKKEAPKFYVVWAGDCAGIFNSWNECKQSINNYKNALYKSFNTKEEAEKAFKESPFKYIGNKQAKSSENLVLDSLSVDAACSGNPGIMEYRGVHVLTKQVWFYNKFPLGTNNTGEFLAIVHGLAELKKRNIQMPLYSDSQIAIGWVKKKICATKLPETEKTRQLFEIIRRAEKWLAQEDWYKSKILKWDTASWGEIPADFGRKG